MITIIASKKAMEALQPLIEAYQKKGFLPRPVVSDKLDVSSELLSHYAEDSQAIVWVGAPRRSPRTLLTGPVLIRGDGTAIPIGYLPESSIQSIRLFAETAAKVQLRDGAQQPVAILGQRHKKYIRLATRIETLLNENNGKTPPYRWTSDLLVKEEMLKGLRTGLGLALYFGHGRPIGWVGYYGLRKHHFEESKGEPLGALLSICCATASRKRTGLSFSEAIPLQGAAAASFGAVMNTYHTDNTRWAVRITNALQKGVTTIGELIVAASPPTQSAMDSYRIFGDPLAPICGTQQAIQFADKIKVYP
ncbi:C25 family cysteine peptidase [Aequorivita nionensis]|jgi:hypothetical protein|uniref:C25 family cysteine peptidase n=1 Tax=Aequorivita nionensis TaxID=1287690 RepID=UPI002B648FEE|nr:C25 family cysteine peptidase [Aequorivita sp.]